MEAFVLERYGQKAVRQRRQVPEPEIGPEFRVMDKEDR